ncbi:hypothetical protein Fmac_024777 [Flemingia macrophylla]|uniref:RNA helicase n=1 Tax=Flemingia macrophylla TaxID=520843 RepID=A0ABD1LQB3_9FABA
MPSGNRSGIAGNARRSMFGPPVRGPSPLSTNSLIRPPYMGSSDVADLSAAEVYCQQHKVTTTGDNIPPPFMKFDATGFPPEILREIYSAGFSNPTPIQAQTSPVALQGRDIVAIAKIGFGKTLGYLTPAFILLRQRHNNSLNGPIVLVLAPIGELATQIQEEVIKFELIYITYNNKIHILFGSTLYKNFTHVEVVLQMEKQMRLLQILRSQERGSKVIIFCSTKRLCDQLARSIG